MHTSTTTTKDVKAPRGTAGSQTLSRGLTALEVLANSDRPLTLNELADELGVHRSNAYRVLRTLEEHRFVARDQAGLIKLGPKLTVLARGVSPALTQAAAKPITDLSNSAGMTVFLVVRDQDEAIAVTSIEPTTVDVAVSRKPGTRHSILVGAPGHVLEAMLTPDEREELFGSREFSEAALRAQQLGYCESRDEVIEGVTAVAVPLRIPGELPAALAVAHFGANKRSEELAGQLHLTAARIAQSYE